MMRADSRPGEQRDGHTKERRQVGPPERAEEPALTRRAAQRRDIPVDTKERRRGVPVDAEHNAHPIALLRKNTSAREKTTYAMMGAARQVVDATAVSVVVRGDEGQMGYLERFRTSPGAHSRIGRAWD